MPIYNFWFKEQGNPTHSPLTNDGTTLRVDLAQVDPEEGSYVIGEYTIDGAARSWRLYGPINGVNISDNIIFQIL